MGTGTTDDHRRLHDDENAEMSAGLSLLTISLAVCILNAACMTA